MPTTPTILIATTARKKQELVLEILLQKKEKGSIKIVTTKAGFEKALKALPLEVVVFYDALTNLDSLSAVKLVKDYSPHTAFIFIATEASVEMAVKIIKQGADDYISANNLNTLLKTIDRAIKQQETKKKEFKIKKESSESEKIFKELIENVSNGIITLSNNWEVLYINKTAEKLLNRSRNDLIGKNIWNEFPEAVGGAFYLAYEKAIKNKETIYVEDYSIALQTYTQAVIYPTPIGISVYFHDITKQRKAEIKAKQSEENYRMFLDRITDGFIALDKNFCYTYANQKVGDFVHRSPESLIGKNVWEEFPDAIGSYTYKAFHTAMKEQRFISNIDFYEPLNLWQENHIYPSPEGLSVFIKDISERKRFEQELLEQERKQQLQIAATALEAQEKERIQIGQELHDNVNQIITATKLVLSFLREHPEKADEMMPLCINNLDKVIQENRKLAHELVPPDFTQASFVQELSNLILPMLNTKGIETKIDTSKFNEDLLDVHKKLTVYRIAQEQCTNIVKYAKPKKVECTLTTAQNYFEMVMSDDGVGMKKNNPEKGIGLKNIEGRLKIYDGSMKIQTWPGKGFTLSINIPLLSS